MKFIRCLTLFLALLLCFSSVSFVNATEEETPEQEELISYGFDSDLEVRAKAAMLIELNSNTLVYAYEKDLQRYPASLTKIMTCMLAILHGNPNDVLTVSETALQNLSEFGSSAGLLEGEQLTLDELLYCIMISSANEGCNVIAEHIAGDIPSFIEMMNDQAKKLGMTSTHFANAHGLHDEDHYTTAYDLSLLARWAWKNEQFRKYTTTTTHTIPATNKSEARTLVTTNSLVSTAKDDKYYYEYASGIKTGFTTPAGGCLISTASRDGLDFMSIVLGCSPQTAENGIYGDERFVETKKLFEYGFRSLSYVQVLTDTKMVDMQEVLYADGRSSVVIHAGENVTALLPKSCNPEDIVCKVTYDRELPLAAPLEKGEQVGIVTAYYNGQKLASCPAVTLTAVGRSETKYVTTQVSDAVSDAKSWVVEYWYLFIPIILVALLLMLLLLLRSINIRKAKKRAAMRRKDIERRRRNG